MVGELESLVLELLEPGIFKTTSQLAEEFRAEFPGQWRRLEEEGERLYGRGSEHSWSRPK
jgi:hypothetical protein